MTEQETATLNRLHRVLGLRSQIATVTGSLGPSVASEGWVADDPAVIATHKIGEATFVMRIAMDGASPVDACKAERQWQITVANIVHGVLREECERCAKVAESWPSWCGREGYDSEEYASEDIAAKIRQSTLDITTPHVNP